MKFITVLLRIWDEIRTIDIPTSYIMYFSFFWPLVLLVLAIAKPKKKLFYGIAAAVPVINFLVFYLFNYTKGNVMFGIKRFGAHFIAAVLFALITLWLSKQKRKVLPMVAACLTGFIVFGWSVLYAAGLSRTACLGNFTHMGYEDSISALIDELETYYILRDYKQIDFDALRAEYIPMARQAEEHGSESEYRVVVASLCNEFHDGHLYFLTSNRMATPGAAELTCGNDYGFSMVRLDDGKVVAVCLAKSSDAYRLGIHDGTQITSWSGVDIDEAIDATECIVPHSSITEFPLIENEDIVRPMFLAGTGGETVDVGFIDEDGTEQEITLPRLSLNFTRVEWATNVLTGYWNVEFGHAEMLDDHIGYLGIPWEEYDTYLDIYACLTDEYPQVRDLFISRIEELKAQGMDTLIIDLRGNSGGFEPIENIFVSLFTDHEIVRYSGVCADDGFDIWEEWRSSVPVDGRYSDIPVVVLVNAGCASCGDIMTYDLSTCPNVTVMGFTTTWGSAQSTGGRCLMSGGDIQVLYPITGTLDQNGEVVIDAGADRAGVIELDERIPLNEETVMRLFCPDEDEVWGYEVEYAMEYINGHQ